MSLKSIEADPGTVRRQSSVIVILPTTCAQRLLLCFCLVYPIFIRSVSANEQEADHATLQNLLLQPNTNTATFANKLPNVTLAIQHFQTQQISSCLTSLQKAKTEHPELPPPRLILARLYFNAQQVSKGRAILEQAAVSNPDDPGIYMTFGELAISEQRLTDARLHLQTAQSLPVPKEWLVGQAAFVQHRCLALLAVVFEQQQDWKSAQSALTELVRKNPNTGKLRQRLAQATFFRGNSDKAYEHLQRAARDDVTLEPAELSIVWMFVRQGNIPEAERRLKQAVENAPRDPRILRGMASWLITQNKYSQARKFAEKAEAVDPHSTEMKMMLGMLARCEKQFVEAEQLLKDVVTERPNDVQAITLLALVMADQDSDEKRKAAITLGEQTLARFRHSIDAMSVLGWIYFRNERKQEAENLLRAAVATGKAKPDTAWFLAQLLIDQNKQEEASKLLDSAVKAPGGFAYRVEAEQWLRSWRKRNSSDGE